MSLRILRHLGCPLCRFSHPSSRQHPPILIPSQSVLPFRSWPGHKSLAIKGASAFKCLFAPKCALWTIWLKILLHWQGNELCWVGGLRGGSASAANNRPNGPQALGFASYITQYFLFFLYFHLLFSCFFHYFCSFHLAPFIVVFASFIWLCHILRCVFCDFSSFVIYILLSALHSCRAESSEQPNAHRSNHSAQPAAGLGLHSASGYC